MGNSVTSEEDKALEEIQEKVGYRFRDKNLLIEALTHDSLRVNNPNIPTYQRLEFLGDSVLQLIISEYLIKIYATGKEGFLSEKRKEFVSNSKLHEIASKLQLAKYVKVANGFPAFQIRGYGSFVESILGAIYVDAGYCASGSTPSNNFICRCWKLQKF